MLEEQLTENEVSVVEFIKLVFGDSKLAFTFSLEKVLRSRNLENRIASRLGSTDQEANWFKSGFERAARLFRFAEVWIRFAIEILNLKLPLLLKSSKQWRRNSDKSGSGVDDSWESTLLTYLLRSHENTFSRQSPSFDVRENIWVVSEGFEPFDATDDLVFIDSTNNCEHVGVGKTQTEGSLANKFLFHQRPDEMLILPISTHLWGKSKNTISIGIETFTFLKRKELEIDARVTLSKTSLILGLFALKFGRSVEH